MNYKTLFQLFLGALLIALTIPQQALALDISAPFSYGQQWIAGGYPRSGLYCTGHGSYYGNGYHINKNHYSIDFNGTYNKSCGNIRDDRNEPVLSVADGTVEFNSSLPVAGYGYHIKINHDNGYVSLYAHLEQRPNLSVGQKVVRGQQIGKVGSSGGSWGSHLHFTLYKNGNSVMPSPMDGQTLHANESGKLITSYNKIEALTPTPPPPKQTPAAPAPKAPAKLKAPAILAPQSKEMLNKAPLIKFTWQDVRYSGSGDLRYRFHLFTPTQSSAIYSSAWNKNWTSFEKGFSSWNGTSHLRFAVQVRNSANQIIQSEVRHFYLNFPPKEPTSLSPANNATTSQLFTLSWKDGGDQDNYPKASRNFSARLYKNKKLFRTSVWRPRTNWTIAVDPGTYQWEVCADDGGFVTCTPKRTFKAK